MRWKVDLVYKGEIRNPWKILVGKTVEIIRKAQECRGT
jgi:hypothetical protein